MTTPPRNTEDLRKAIESAETIYRGRDAACRCGCKGTYVVKGTRAFAQRQKQMVELVRGGAKVDGDGTYANISLDNDRALCAYVEA